MLNSIKTQAATLAKLFKAHGIEISRSKSLEYMAQLYGLSDYNALAPHARVLQEDISQLLGKPFRSLDQLRLNGSASEVAIGLTLSDAHAPESQGAEDLQDTAWEVAKAAYAWQDQHGGALSEVEKTHALGSAGNEYGEECVVRTVSGFSLAVPPYPQEVDYIRIVNPRGEETAYWSIDEVQENPADVLGALVGALHPSGALSNQLPVQEGSSIEEHFQPSQVSQSPGYRGLSYTMGPAPEGDGTLNMANGYNAKDSYIDFYLYLNMDIPGQDLGAELKLNVYIDCEEKQLLFGDMGFAPSRESDFDFSKPSATLLYRLSDALFAPGVLEDTVKSLVKALRERHPGYTGWVFTEQDLRKTLRKGIARIAGDVQED